MLNSYGGGSLQKGVIEKKKLYIIFLTIYFICLPLDGMSLGAMGSVLKYIAILPIGISIISARTIKRSSLIGSQLLFVGFTVFSCMWSINSSMSVDRCISYVLLTMLTFSPAVFSFDGDDIYSIKRAFLWSSRSTALIMLIFSEYKYGRFILGGKIDEDPNYLCGFFLAGVIIILQKMLSKESRKIDIAEFLLYLFLILQTGSRGGLLAVGASVVVCIFFNRKGTNAELLKKIGYIVGILLAVIIALNFLPDTLKNRFNYMEAIETGGTGRFDIWTRGLEIFADSTLRRQMFGIGTGTITEVLLMTFYGTTAGYAMHNIYLETLVELGVVGFLCYLNWIMKYMVSAYRDRDKFAFAVIIGMMVLAISTSLHTFKPYFNIMLMIVVLENCEEPDYLEFCEDAEHFS